MTNADLSLEKLVELVSNVHESVLKAGVISQTEERVWLQTEDVHVNVCSKRFKIPL